MTDFVDGHPRRSRRVRHDPIETHGGALDPVAAVEPARPLCEWTEFLISRGHRTLYLDEIHQSPEWAAHLKATYDAHPEVSIMVSGSSSLLATAGVADLSRRFVSARVRVVRKTRDKPVLSIGAKLFLADPSLYRALSGQEGNAREAFVACAIESAGMTLHAESDERRGDFIVDGSIRIEVGGRTKERKSADVVVRDGLDVPSPGVLPLWSLGFLW